MPMPDVNLTSYIGLSKEQKKSSLHARENEKVASTIFSVTPYNKPKGH
jgi:hypothetical protein